MRPFFLPRTLAYPPDIVDIELPRKIDADTILTPIPDSARTFSTNSAYIKIPENYLSENITRLVLQDYQHEIKNIIPPSLKELRIESYHKSDIVIPQHVTTITLDNVHANVTILADRLKKLVISGKYNVDLSNVSYISYIRYDRCGIKLAGIDIDRLSVSDIDSNDLNHVVVKELVIYEYMETINPVIMSCMQLSRIFMQNIPADVNDIDESIEIYIFGNHDYTLLRNGQVRRILRIYNTQMIASIAGDLGDLVCVGTSRNGNNLILDIIHKNHIPSNVKSARS